MKSEQEGVHFAKREQKWIAKIYRAGKLHYIGSYHIEAEAIGARQKAERILDTMQPKESVTERRAERKREKILQQIDDDFNKKTLLPKFI